MAKKSKFTDRQKKNMVRLYVETQNYSAVARKYGCSETSVRRIVGKNADVAEMVEQEKEENTKSVREHMKKQTKDVCDLLDKLVMRIGDEEKLEKATAVQLATALGILIDKYRDEKNEDENASGGVIILPEIEEGE